MTMPHSAIIALHQVKFNVPTAGDVYMLLEASDPKEIDPEELIKNINYVSLPSAVSVVKDEVGYNHGNPVVIVPVVVGDQTIELSFAMPKGDFSQWEDEDIRRYYVDMLQDYKDDIIASIQHNVVGS